MDESDPKYMKWSKARTVDFLTRIKKFPCLWDPLDKNFRSKHYRTIAFETIAADLKSNKKAIQTKLNYLIGYYAREMKRIVNSIDDLGPRIDWYDEANFLNSAACKRVNVVKKDKSIDDEKRYVLCREICRICLIRTDKNARPCIDVADKFKFYTGFDIKLRDAHYPAFICSNCNSELETCCIFLEKSKKAEIVLQKIYDCTDEDAANQVFIDLTTKVEPPIEYVKLEIEPVCYDDVEQTAENNFLDFEGISEPEFDVKIESSVENESEKKPQKAYNRRRAEVICYICGKLVVKYRMKKHFNTHHNESNSTQRSVCDICGKDYKYSDALSKHKRIHSQDKRYQCQFCDLKFMHWSGRRFHIRSKHMKVKPFHCRVCQKGFLLRCRMAMHLKDEHGEHEIQCEKCQKVLKNTKSLQIHMKVTHSEAANIFCDVCNKGFKAKKYLKQHYVIHTGEKNYKCPVCEKAFAQNHVMRTHCSKLHPEHQLPPKGAIASIAAIEKLKIIQEKDAGYVKTDLEF